MGNFVHSIERQEQIQKLIDSGYYELVDTLLYKEGVYTKKDRLNKSGACRTLNWKTKQLEDALKECRRLLGEDAF